VLESVDSEYQGRVAVVRIDAAEDPDGARGLGAFVVPLLVALRDGREHARKVGAATRAEVRAVFGAALADGPVAPAGVSRNERALRLLAGLGLVGIGLATGPRWGLAVAGAALLVLAFHDRLRSRWPYGAGRPAAPPPKL
jgi:hypothetical protein